MRPVAAGPWPAYIADVPHSKSTVWKIKYKDDVEPRQAELKRFPLFEWKGCQQLDACLSSVPLSKISQLAC
jgi:hypothetical protein